MVELLNFLEENEIKFSLNEPLLKHTNFHIGGACSVMTMPNTTPKLIRLLKFLNEKKIEHFVIGAGTNLLCSDQGYDGVIIKLGGVLKDYKVFGNCVYAESGMNLFALNRLLLACSLQGMEFSYGIPGSVGGVIYMNAGAYGKSVEDFVESVKVFDGTKIRTLSKADMQFSYRHSVLQTNNFVVLGATFKLNKGNALQIESMQKEILQKRLNSQPYHQHSAGSVFKRLEEGKTPVSKMIDDLGLKGYSIGDAQVSTLHAGFIVNKGQATCKDVKSLIKYIREKVKASYNENIELEIELLGDTDDIKR